MSMALVRELEEKCSEGLTSGRCGGSCWQREDYLVAVAENAKNYILPLLQTKELGERTQHDVYAMLLPRLTGRF